MLALNVEQPITGYNCGTKASGIVVPESGGLLELEALRSFETTRKHPAGALMPEKVLLCLPREFGHWHL
jgi:hypothetical protein